jgi:hypothetical protein
MITAVVIKYKRIKELNQIISSLEKIPEITEILIHDNTKNNIFTYGRYFTAKQAKNSIIYTQDDDCLIDHIPELIRTFDGNILVNTLKPSHAKKSQYKKTETLVGWGSLFKKEWIDVFDQYIKVYGEDYLLYRGADRIFTSLLCQTIKRITLVKEIYAFPSARNKSIALYKRDDYQKIIKKVRQRIKNLI